jgi:hypothetical protein
MRGCGPLRRPELPRNAVKPKFGDHAPATPPGRTGTEDDHRAPSTRALLKGAMSPKTKTPLKVMLVEDHLAFRQALAFVLQSEQGLKVIAQAGSLAEARRALDGGGLGGAWTWRL